MTTPPVYFVCELTGRQSFACEKLRASISVEACRSNFTGGRAVSCRGCKTGELHAGKRRTAADIARDPNAERHARSAAKNSQTCVRCLRGPSDAKTVCQWRLILGAWCTSCDMRSGECRKNGGLGALNSKGTPSAKYRSLRAAQIVLITADARLVELRPMVFGGAGEIRRYLDRMHDGWSLAEVRHADGEVDFLES